VSALLRLRTTMVRQHIVRQPWLALIFASGCSSWFHYKDHVRELAAETSCCPDFQVTELRSWAFRVQSCGTTTYWRCSTSDFGECCWPVATEHDATKAIALAGYARATCWGIL